MRFLLLIFVLFVFTGCEKVIELKTGRVPPKYVIEANLSSNLNDCKVIITTTIPLGEPTVFKGVRNAQVRIQENESTPVLLTETTPGVYESPFLRAKEGSKYTLMVSVANEEFYSTVTVPQKVNFDSLYIIDFSAFGNVRKLANVIFNDPAGVPNSYRFLQYNNGVYNPNIFIMNDEFSNGRPINTYLTFFDDSENLKIVSGDTIRVEMQGIDPSVYLYFNSLNQSSTGGSEVAAPGNPVTNITGGALGYFNAYVKQERTVVVK